MLNVVLVDKCHLSCSIYFECTWGVSADNTREKKESISIHQTKKSSPDPYIKLKKSSPYPYIKQKKSSPFFFRANMKAYLKLRLC